MAITTDEIVWGETYDISISAQDTGGNSITLDGTWSAACRITEDHVGGDIVLNPTMTIAAGVATTSIDTGNAEFLSGVYYYDIRLTDAAGHDYWTSPVRLILANRNTPNT
jgi:hypothetical protein